MNLYPAMRMSMGSWDYFSVKMTMQQVADNVKFAAEVHDDPTLAMTIQRQLDQGRVKKEIVHYLINQPDRFFGSIVIAALGGDPKFYPVTIENTPALNLFADDDLLNKTFGVLKFDGTQHYYALDGQHRLAAIKNLVDPASPFVSPAGFSQEHLTVMVVVPARGETKVDFLVRYRRLFGNLNRYAKPMDNVTSIAMDEDDAFAIVTRRLITEFNYFKAVGRQWDSHRVKTDKGKSMRSGESQVTSLETLYEINIELLKTNSRRHDSWAASSSALKLYQRTRPPESELDNMFVELSNIWEGLIAAVPELERNPAESRNHEAEGDAIEMDSFLFWPISQEILAACVREHLNRRGLDTASGGITADDISRALEPFGKVNWSLHALPWRGLLLVKNEKDAWTMRSDDRAKVAAYCRQLLSFMVGTVEVDESDLEYVKGTENLASAFRAYWTPVDDETWEEAWQKVSDMLLDV